MQDLPQEYNRFARVDKSYMKMMKRAYETRNVLQVLKQASQFTFFPQESAIVRLSKEQQYSTRQRFNEGKNDGH